jgi:signal transduction histidine kinase
MTSNHFDRRAVLCGLAACFCLASASVQAANPTQKDAVTMTDKAAAYAKANGSAKLIERINAKDPEFLSGELYVVVLKPDGTHLAHPVNPKLIGKSMLDVPDPDGKLFRKERVDLAASKGKGWVDYKYKNPENGKIEQKTAYVLMVGDVILSAGVYKD